MDFIVAPSNEKVFIFLARVDELEGGSYRWFGLRSLVNSPIMNGLVLTTSSTRWGPTTKSQWSCEIFLLLMSNGLSFLPAVYEVFGFNSFGSWINNKYRRVEVERQFHTLKSRISCLSIKWTQQYPHKREGYCKVSQLWLHQWQIMWNKHHRHVYHEKARSRKGNSESRWSEGAQVVVFLKDA